LSISEAVLVMLVSTFKFAPTKDKVIWQMNEVSSPFVEDGEKGSLPLLISLAGQKDAE
jgi:hypothetical protein